MYIPHRPDNTRHVCMCGGGDDDDDDDMDAGITAVPLRNLTRQTAMKTTL